MTVTNETATEAPTTAPVVKPRFLTEDDFQKATIAYNSLMGVYFDSPANVFPTAVIDSVYDVLGEMCTAINGSECPHTYDECPNGE